MKIELHKLESSIFGINVIKLDDFTATDEIINAEEKIHSEYGKAYVYCLINATDLTAIHQLEENGFRFSEFRIRSFLRTEEYTARTQSLYPYVAEIIGEKKHKDKAIEILQSNFYDDRFYSDPEIDKEKALQRHIAYLEKSYEKYPEEFLLGIFHAQTNDLLAFRSGVMIPSNSAHFYQYAVSPDYNHDQMASVMETFTIDYLKQKKVRLIYAVSTGFNISELNRLVKQHDFKIDERYVVMRKIYRD